MGESEKHPQKTISEAVQAMIVDTLGGRVQVSWDKESAATPFGQLVFFAEFLKVACSASRAAMAKSAWMPPVPGT